MSVTIFFILLSTRSTGSPLRRKRGSGYLSTSRMAIFYYLNINQMAGIVAKRGGRLNKWLVDIQGCPIKRFRYTARDHKFKFWISDCGLGLKYVDPKKPEWSRPP